MEVFVGRGFCSWDDSGMKTGEFHLLRICDLSLWVRLGCSAEEKATPQEVKIGVELRFHQPPSGCRTDQLDETICYAKISAAFRRYCEEREFSLVEKMAGDLKSLAQEFVGPQAAVAVSVHKVKPPVPGLQGGVIYRVGDFS